MGVFDEARAQLLVRHRFAHVFSDFNEFFRKWGYLLDAQQIALIEGAINQKELFTSPGLEKFEAPERLKTTFESLLLLESRLSANSAVTSLLADINFNPKTIMSLLEGRHRNPRTQSLIRYFDGFVTSIEYMGDCRQFFNDLRDDENTNQIPEQDRFLFQRRVKQLQEWRLNFRLKTNETIFMMFIDRCSELTAFKYQSVMGRYLDPSAMNLDWNYIKRQITDLMTDWGLQLTKTANN